MENDVKQHVNMSFYQKLNRAIDETNRRKIRKYFCAFGLFLLCFVMLLTCVNDFYFESDEGEIFSKGVSIAHGQLLYKDNASQHMPVAYYIAALFNMTGATNVLRLRLCFYVFFALLWALNVVWYGDDFPLLSIILCPILYIITISRISLDTSILSEHFQSTGIAILFYELMLFHKSKTLGLCNCIRISLAIFLAFGSAFTTVFPVFFLALTVFALELENRIRHRAECDGQSWRKMMIHRYGLLLIVVLVPFVVLCGYYLITGSLDDFYYWAYKFNVDVYSKYQGVGGSVIQSLFAGFNYILNPIKAMAANPDMLFLGLFTALGLTSIVVIGILSKSIILVIGLLFMLNGCETRCGIEGFHAIHAVMLFSAMIGYVVGMLVSKIKAIRLRSLITAFLLLIVLFLFSDRWAKMPDALRFNDVGKSEIGRYVDIITEEGERIGNATLQEGIFVYSETVPASTVGGTVKWMWDGGSETAMRQLREAPPKVYILDESYAVWGYPIADYAGELIDFVHENYTSLSKYALKTVYVRNDYYQKACDLINSSIRKTNREITLQKSDKLMMHVDTLDIQNDFAYINGWAALSDGTAAEQNVFIVVRYEDGSTHMFKAEKYPRSDVAQVFNNELLYQSGFRVRFDKSKAPNLRTRDMFIVIEDDRGIFTDARGLKKAKIMGINR